MAGSQPPATGDATFYRLQGLNPDGITPHPTDKPLLDTDNLIDYLLVTWYCGSFDAPMSTFLNEASNNWFATRNRTGNFGGFRFAVHDFEHGMGTDVGAGTGLSMLKEGLVAYHVHAHALRPAHVLHLATAAGARAIGLGEICGDLTPGKAADLVLIKPPPGSTLEQVLDEAPDWNAALGAIFTLAREESIAETRVGGDVVFRQSDSRIARAL